MNKIVIIAGLLLSIILLHSCESDQLVEPANVSFEVSMVGKGLVSRENDDEKRQAANQPKNRKQVGLYVEEGRLNISEIEFEGTRENDENYYFSRLFDPVLTADLAKDELNQSVEFSIPEGSYSRIKLIVHLSNEDSSGALSLHGEYVIGNAMKHQVELQFFNYEEEQVEITLENPEGGKQVVLNKSEPKNLQLQLNLGYLFRTFNPGMLHQAQITQTPNGEIIEVSTGQNTDIYYNLVQRINNSFKAVIK